MPRTRLIPLLLLLGILATSLGARLWGIRWGLPNAERFTTLYVDEYTPIWVLHKMNLRKLDFNPHYSHNPTFFYYQIGAVLAIAQKLGLVTLNAEKSYYLDHTEEYAKIYLAGRLLCVLYGVAATLMLFLLGKTVTRGNVWAGLGIAFLHALLPISAIQCHVIDTSVPASFWLALAFLLLLKASDEKRGTWLWAGALAAGLSCSTKYTSLPVVPLVFLTAWTTTHPLKNVSVALALVGLGFLIGTPYMLLDAAHMLAGFFEMSQSAAGTHSATTWTRLWYPLAHFQYGVGTPLTILCGLGLLGALESRPRAAILATLFLIPFFLLLGRSTLHVSRYLNESLPFLLPFAALPFVYVRHIRGGLALGLVLGLLCLWRVPYTLAIDHSLSSEQDPRDQASDWIRAHVPNGTRIGLEKEANFMMPGHLYMHYWKGSRYPADRVSLPAIEFAVWDLTNNRWEPESPDYWVETNLFSRRIAKNVSDETAQASVLRLMQEGYTPVAHFERSIGFGPLRYRMPARAGSDWQILLPDITLYARAG